MAWVTPVTPGVQGNVHSKLELKVQDGTVTMTISFSCLRRIRAHFRREGQGLAEGLLFNEKGADSLSQSLPPVHGDAQDPGLQGCLLLTPRWGAAPQNWGGT